MTSTVPTHDESAAKVRQSEKAIGKRLEQELSNLFPSAPQGPLEKLAYRFQHGSRAPANPAVAKQFVSSNSLFNIEHDVIPTPAYPELQAFGERFSSRLKFV